VKQNEQDATLTTITAYNHHHAKLLLSSLALSVSGFLHDKSCSQAVDAEYVTIASQLFTHCFSIVVDRLTATSKLGKYIRTANQDALRRHLLPVRTSEKHSVVT